MRRNSRRKSRLQALQARPEPPVRLALPVRPAPLRLQVEPPARVTQHGLLLRTPAVIAGHPTTGTTALLPKTADLIAAQSKHKGGL